ncbi:hypothetical protein MPTK1_1g07460 [Marchantia polymorpha subsp. ruderalis]|uniref:Fungal lipase-type domain-containing protein n=2 Tax=Marchantia polymorpha TaxID=3197 RepID=A0AAF6AMK4_MARPO|nr:hypothetical protein MARPO_0043s0139 [Marchantia polymorpha]BBM97674.1 hypothetical protein Mp_1g07460 [Marchantia polymorpha subsp. ruderalis]|eukprot:PTQ39917.1 hypothetical protein MARPO_0043s0139 [Marchantia polymorpha]
MESLICRASNVVISCGAIRGEVGGVSGGTQEKEKKAKVVDKARVGEKASPASAAAAASSASGGGGRSYTSLAPLPFPPARSLVPAPLRFLWFSNSGKNEEPGSSSGSSGGARDGRPKDSTPRNGDGDVDGAAQPDGGAAAESEQPSEDAESRSRMPGAGEEGLTSMGLLDAETERERRIDAIIDGSVRELGKFENGNAAKRWIQNLLSVNFLKKSPRIEVKVPSLEEAPAADDLQAAIGAVGIAASPSSVSASCETIVSVADESAPAGAKQTARCVGCEAEIGNSCAVDPAANPLSTLEVAHLNVTHDLESFSKFLHQVPLSELRIISQTSYLSNLAYVIPEIQAGELARIHRLVFVTSSIEIKAKALAEEKEAAAAKGETDKSEAQSEAKQEFYLSPASAYALAAAAASFLKSEKKSRQAAPQKSMGDSSDQTTGTKSGETTENEGLAGPNTDVIQSSSSKASGEGEKSEKSQGDREEVPDMPSFMRPVTSVVSAEKETKQAMAKNLRSLHTCPCEWFAVDEKSGPTRIFSIQGSESFASWQANLLFEPIEFENSGLGVMVHRGIYEAAKGLYEQVLPYVLEHLKTHGESARIRFAGHSLGGSLGMLLSLMLHVRGVLNTSNLLPVYTYGAPYIMCGGDYLLKKLGLPLTHVQSIVMHRDIVPRTFACNYPDHVAEVLRRVNGTFRDHSCLVRQRLLYAPMGQLMVLQPDQRQASFHPLLPSGSGLYLIKHRSHNENKTADGSVPSREVEVRAAQRSFLNQPHPLEILSDPGSYGSEGSISKHHDPRNYYAAINSVLRSEMRRWRRIQRERRRQLWWPLVSAESSHVLEAGAKSGVITEQGPSKGVKISQGMVCGPTGQGHFVSDLAAGRATFPISVSESCKGRFSRYKSLIASQHVHMGMLLILSARMLIVQGFSVVLAWV